MSVQPCPCAAREGATWTCGASPAVICVDGPAYCPSYPHERGMAYSAELDAFVCPRCGWQTTGEQGSL